MCSSPCMSGVRVPVSVSSEWFPVHVYWERPSERPSLTRIFWCEPALVVVVSPSVVPRCDVPDGVVPSDVVSDNPDDRRSHRLGPECLRLPVTGLSRRPIPAGQRVAFPSRWKRLSSTAGRQSLSGSVAEHCYTLPNPISLEGEESWVSL